VNRVSDVPGPFGRSPSTGIASRFESAAPTYVSNTVPDGPTSSPASRPDMLSGETPAIGHPGVAQPGATGASVRFVTSDPARVTFNR
jgi:hypothetical protein